MTSRFTQKVLIALAFVMAAGLLGACASQSGSGGTGGTPQGGAQQGSDDGYGYGGGRGSTGSDQGGTVAATVTAGAGGQLAFSPSELSVKQGQSIKVENAGSIAHTFTIASSSVDAVADPGQSQTVKIDLSPGTYTFVCRFHEGSGMQGTLTVTA